jgi:hypothetical protein
MEKSITNTNTHAKRFNALTPLPFYKDFKTQPSLYYSRGHEEVTGKLYSYQRTALSIKD